MSMMEYKGYLGTVEYSKEDGCLYGQLAYIRDLINYEAETVKELEQSFYSSVDSYLKSCEIQNKEPNKPFKGVFNVRLKPDLHRKAVIASGNDSLNSFVVKAIEERILRTV